MSVHSPGISVDLLESRSGWFSSLPLGAAFLSLAFGSVVLLGRAFDLSFLQSVLPGITTVKTSAATSFILGGGSLLMLVRGREAHLWARLFAAGLLALMIVGWVGLALTEVGLSTIEPVGLGFQATFGFTLQGAALLLLTNTRLTARMVGAELALAAAFVGWAGLILYTYSAGLVSWESVSPMVFISFGATVLGLGTAAADEVLSPFRVLQSDGPGGALARYLVPIVAITPFVLGWIHLAGQRAGWYEPTLGVAVLTIASSVLFAFIVVTYATRLDRSEERRQSAERVLRESAEFNTQIVASAQEGIVVVDEHQRCVLWNPFMERLTGVPARDVVGKPLMQATSFGVLTQLEAMERALAGQHVEDDVERPTPSGIPAWLLVAHTPLKNADGGIRGAIVTIHDITELKRAEQALRDSQKRTSTALAALGVGVWELDLATRAVVWTENASPLLASSPDSIRALNDLIDRIHPDDRVPTLSAIEGAIANKGDFDVESRVVLPDGTVRWMRSKGRVVPDPMGGAERLIGVTSDTTGRHLLETQFLQAQKMEAVGQLAGGVAHDFNNLLTAILGYSAMVKEGIGDPVGRKNVDEVIKAAMRATALTKQLLAFSRRETPEVVVLNANEVVQDLLDMLRRLIGEHVILTTSLAARIHSTRIDRGQLEQVIVNLVVNSRDAMPRGGHIEIDTANVHVESDVSAHGGPIPHGHYVMLAVSDTGIGISDEVRAHLFEPFFTTKGRGKGTGLGLATVHGIVAAAQGYIAVQSEIGKGAIFQVYLPASVDPVGEIRARNDDPPLREVPSIGATVLIVEDEEAVRYLARVILERAGYKVFEASTLEQAEAMLSDAGPIDVLVSDVMLPGGRGTDLYARLRSRYPALRVVFMSGYVDDEILKQTQLDSAMRFIQKPFAADALLSNVTSLLASANAGR
jgi:PAS domain S-box-containing protein